MVVAASKFVYNTFSGYPSRLGADTRPRGRAVVALARSACARALPRLASLVALTRPRGAIVAVACPAKWRYPYPTRYHAADPPRVMMQSLLLLSHHIVLAPARSITLRHLPLHRATSLARLMPRA